MWCGLCGFLIIKLKTVLHHAMRCIITRGAVWYSYTILRAVLMQFLRFGKHPYQ